MGESEGAAAKESFPANTAVPLEDGNQRDYRDAFRRFAGHPSRLPGRQTSHDAALVSESYADCVGDGRGSYCQGSRRGLAASHVAGTQLLRALEADLKTLFTFLLNAQEAKLADRGNRRLGTRLGTPLTYVNRVADSASSRYADWLNALALAETKGAPLWRNETPAPPPRRFDFAPSTDFLAGEDVVHFQSDDILSGILRADNRQAGSTAREAGRTELVEDFGPAVANLSHTLRAVQQALLATLDHAVAPQVPFKTVSKTTVEGVRYYSVPGADADDDPVLAYRWRSAVSMSSICFAAIYKHLRNLLRFATELVAQASVALLEGVPRLDRSGEKPTRGFVDGLQDLAKRGDGTLAYDLRKPIVFQPLVPTHTAGRQAQWLGSDAALNEHHDAFQPLFATPLNRGKRRVTVVSIATLQRNLAAVEEILKVYIAMDTLKRKR